MTDRTAHAPIGVALLGYGFAGEIFHAPFITTTPGLDLRVVASRQTARVAASCPGVPSEVLLPRNTWSDKAASDTAATKLKGLFDAEAKKYG